MVLIPRVNQILKHDLFKEYSQYNSQAEEKRAFCRHGLDHGIAVARIAYIYLLEQQNTSLSKEVIYAAGLLHDLGRWREYETGEDHALAGAELVKPIIQDSGFSIDELETITQGIREHRLNPEGKMSLLGRALAYADDWARDCRNCLIKEACYKYTEQMDEIIC
ncbi:HD domain-containing protein [Desulfitobacterium sp. AusDCA]|uniref:HD domain-containing protein n=1 Tax=Desulfitobacterium sp. AusDCA TaxID=3240383 RepID=UPI003DA79DFE